MKWTPEDAMCLTSQFSHPQAGLCAELEDVTQCRWKFNFTGESDKAQKPRGNGRGMGNVPTEKSGSAEMTATQKLEAA